MKKNYYYSLLVIGIWSLVIATLVAGCGEQKGSYGGGDQSSSVKVSNLFDVSGAKAIVSAASTGTSGLALAKDVKALVANVTDLLKLTASGEFSSILNLPSGSRPPISVIEKSPDGSLYVGFQWGVWIQDSSTSESRGRQIAFFRIYPTGTTESVDDTLNGVGTWYGDSNNGDLPVKQVQWDNDGNLYYLGTAQGSGGGTTVLKKKTPAGVLSQIGNSQMAVRDFYVCPNGFVLFHGSDAGNWSIEWLRLIYNNSVKSIFYNDGYTGWLRSYYYVPSNNSIILVGTNLQIKDQNDNFLKYSGIIQVKLDTTGKITSVKSLYDDSNAWDDSRTISNQILYGYWDGTEQKRFFKQDSWGGTSLPLSLESGVSEETVRNFIREKYFSTTTDTLGGLTFEAMNITGTGESVHGAWVSNIADKISVEVNAHLAGTTKNEWKIANGLQGVNFGWAKQLVLADNGSLYAILKLDSWSSGTSAVKGDRIYRIVNSSGEPSIEAFSRHSKYRTINKARAYGDYLIYLANNGGESKILRNDLTSVSTSPVDMTSSKSSVIIYSFNFNPLSSLLYFDVYDMTNNTSYVVEQLITSATASSEKSTAGKIITDVVPFTVN
ncbi:hypothetical protein HZC34_01970 [Candidatus Saganbacteria bacterium]|nr:hypothetical protein [Candidatus Saganbacteria bacterium]